MNKLRIEQAQVQVLPVINPKLVPGCNRRIAPNLRPAHPCNKPSPPRL